MPALTVHLSDDLAEFVRQSVADGNYTSTDDLFAHALGLVRTESVLGRGSTGFTPRTEPIPPPSRLPA